MQEALTSVNKQLASELAIKKCVQQKSELALKDTQLEAMKQKLTEFKPHNIRRRLQRKKVVYTYKLMEDFHNGDLKLI